ncbi:MAG: hypothetical protein LAT62_12350 [Natronospirillum sp.]|uniref:hypothetical protein n=1 Tax=Natronospirillum sp. TaxID=2812955 RepID=UPI0025FF59BE|nr:hypothetical protein [Natronospirillum sp.]MCH8552720.1 hypothetical protein [Natronospirillum sp.]
MPAHQFSPHQVAATHRQISLWYPNNRISEQMDFAHLQCVTVISADDALLWRLDGPDQQVMLIPFGIEGEGELRRELQALPGFDIDLLFAYLDERTDVQPPLDLWRS